MANSEVAIKTEGLVKRYGKKVALDGLSLEVPRGSVFAFLGRNGAGKTSAIRIMLNLLDRDAGEVRVLGMDARKEEMKIKRCVGYVAEGQRMYDWMTISQLIWFVSGFYPTWDAQFAEELLRGFELNPYDKLGNLSRGTQAKVALLLAMAHRPELLILDEPTAGLDVIVRREFLEGVIDMIQQEGRTVFFSSHLVHEVERVADWVGLIDCGKLISWGPLEELKASIKRIVLTFPDFVPAALKVEGLLTLETSSRQARLVVKNHSDKVIAQLQSYRPQSLDVEELGLEDIFVALVGKGE